MKNRARDLVMRPWPRLLAALALCAVAAMAPGPVGAAGDAFVNTTEDLLYQSSLCLPGKPCSLRAAIARFEGRGGNVRACYDPAEVGGAKKCPPGWLPLTKSDPGYDPESGKWFFPIGEGHPPIELATDDNVIDFTRDVDSWDGPEDNRIVLTSGNNSDLKQAISLELGTGNKFMGFEVRGSYGMAAIDVLDGASGNQFGPGLILSGITQGAGLRFNGKDVTGNRVVGSWCGITGDGTEVNPVADDCVQFLDRAHDNFIGGDGAADRNVFTASRLGVGVAVFGAATGNQVRGNWLGLDAKAEPRYASNGGLRIAEEAHNTVVAGNTIGGHKGAGIAVSDASRDVIIENNRIGTGPDGQVEAANREYGVRVAGLPKGTLIRKNRIAFNQAGGVYISGSTSYDNTLSENSITENDGPAIQVLQGANRNIKPPQITFVDPQHVAGLTCGGCRLEFFSDPGEQADTYEAAVTAAEDGVFQLSFSPGFTYRNVVATTTDGRNTSALSAVAVIGGPTPTPRPVTPSPTATLDPTALRSIYLPWLGSGSP